MRCRLQRCITTNSISNSAANMDVTINTEYTPNQAPAAMGRKLSTAMVSWTSSAHGLGDLLPGVPPGIKLRWVVGRHSALPLFYPQPVVQRHFPPADLVPSSPVIRPVPHHRVERQRHQLPHNDVISRRSECDGKGKVHPAGRFPVQYRENGRPRQDQDGQQRQFLRHTLSHVRVLRC